MIAARIDFLRQPGVPRLGWVLLSTGMIGLASALWTARTWSTAHEQAERAELAVSERRRISERPAPPAKPSIAQLRWQQAQVVLHRPWLPALRAVEAATASPVYLLSLSIEPTTGIFKIEGDAPSFDHAMAYVQMLDEGGALAPATLLSHEQATEPGSGRSFVRFVATTRWNVQ